MLTNHHYRLAAQLQVEAQHYITDRIWHFIATEMSQHTIASIISDSPAVTFDEAKARIMQVVADWTREGLIDNG